MEELLSKTAVASVFGNRFYIYSLVQVQVVLVQKNMKLIKMQLLVTLLSVLCNVLNKILVIVQYNHVV